MFLSPCRLAASVLTESSSSFFYKIIIRTVNTSAIAEEKNYRKCFISDFIVLLTLITVALFIKVPHIYINNQIHHCYINNQLCQLLLHSQGQYRRLVHMRYIHKFTWCWSIWFACNIQL